MLQDGVGSEAGKRLYINAEKDADGNETGRYFVGISGDHSEFASMNVAAGDLQGMIDDDKIVEFGLTNRDLAQDGGGRTYAPGEVGNVHTRVLVNPSQMWASNDYLNNVAGQLSFEGQGRFPPWKIRPFTTTIMAWHELGHARRIMHGARIGDSSSEAWRWENLMRLRKYGPLGPNNARRVAE